MCISRFWAGFTPCSFAKRHAFLGAFLHKLLRPDVSLKSNKNALQMLLFSIVAILVTLGAFFLDQVQFFPNAAC